MPSKNSLFKFPDRNYIFNMNFYKKNLVKERNVTLSFKECKDIIESSNKNIAFAIEDEIDGFKLPFGLGYLVPVSFVPKNNYVDHVNSKKLGKTVYHLNFHTFGKACTIKWFKAGKKYNNKNHEIFKFGAYKTLSISISKAFRSGKNYVEWKIIDFIEKGRLENLYNKKYRNNGRN